MLCLSGGGPSQKPRHKKGRPMGALSLYTFIFFDLHDTLIEHCICHFHKTGNVCTQDVIY
jgi:hypothetical protein